MIENKNKTTGDYLSVIPKFTVNSTLSWQATQDLSMQSTLTGTAVRSRRSTTTVVNWPPAAKPARSALMPSSAPARPMT